MSGPAGIVFLSRMSRRLAGASRIAIVGIGDELSPVDRLGMLAARKIDDQPIPGTTILYAGTVPESITARLRKLRPDHILLLDAAEMGERPGTLAIIEPGTIKAELFSTHALPLSAIMEFIREDIGTEVTLVGIQPDLSGTGDGLSDDDREYLEWNLNGLAEILRWKRVPLTTDENTQ